MITSLAEAVAAAGALLEGTSDRVILGLTGAPGSGKSTLARALAEAIPGSVVVGMDGYHLAHSVLVAQGSVERKGAIDTFDSDGYLALLRRLRDEARSTVWAPEFRREIEDAIAGAIPVLPEHRFVITEGNYLLVDAPPWSAIPDLCDEVWFVDPGEQQRLAWLVARHERYGRTPTEAHERAARGSDAVNATLIAATRDRADRIVHLT